MKISVVLIRHGKTEGNINHEYIGKTDESLSALGIDELRINCKDKVYPHGNFIYTSGMIRCVETANIIYPNKAKYTEFELRECDFGDFEKKNYEELKGRPKYLDFLKSGSDATFPNGENTGDFGRRCVAAFENILRRHEEGEVIIVVCHGGTIMAILDKYSSPHEDFYTWQVKNTEGYRFEFDTNLGVATDIKKLQGKC